MDNAEVRTWLNRGRTLQREIDALKRAREEAMARTVNITSALRRVPASGGANSRGDTALVKYADGDYAGRLSQLIREQEEKLFEISRAIYAVEDGTLRLLLINRYILFKTWEQIAVDMNYGYRQVLRLHGRSLSDVREKMS